MKKTQTFVEVEALAHTPLSIPLTSSLRDIRYLSFQGGGMKGIGDVGALEVLEEQGILSQIEAVAGSSVGGIMAMLVAIGYTPAEIKVEMLHLDFKGLQDKAAPGWIESINPSAAIQFNPLGGLEHAENIGNLLLGSSWGLFEGDRLCCVLSQMLAKKGLSPNLSFAELKAIADHTENPQKNLILTGTNLSTSLTEYYSAEETPTMSIVEAVRISASFPGAFKPIRTMETVIEDGVPKSVETIRVDGGLLENLPDVFNKPPYHSPDAKSPGNPQVLAFSFQDQPLKVSKKGRGLLHLLYETVLSEKKFKKKYGDTVIDIDTVGMGTLEFEASESKKIKLIGSGREAAYKTLRNILKREEAYESKAGYQSLYESMSVEALVRTEAALKRELVLEQGHRSGYTQHAQREQQLIAVRRLIYEKFVDSKNPVPEKELAALREAAHLHFERLGGIKQSDQAALPEEDLRKFCHEKQKKLEITRGLIEKKVDDLYIAKQALIAYGDHLKEKIEGADESAKAFREDLNDLVNLQAERSQYFLAEENPSEETLSNNKERIEFALKEKASVYEKKDPLLAQFFEYLLKKTPNFTVPLDAIAMDAMLAPDLKKCDTLIEDCRLGLVEYTTQSHVEQAFLGSSNGPKNHKSHHYEALLELNMVLDSHIYQKTNLLLKLNDFFVEKAPVLAVITKPFFRFISMLSFIALLPASLPAIGVAKAIGRFSQDEDLKMTARKVERFFLRSDLKHNLQLKEIQAMTKHCMETIKQNYDRADDSEMTYLFKMHALYLQQSGIDFESIIPRKSHEKMAEYKSRVERLKQRFSDLAKDKDPLALAPEQAKPQELAPGVFTTVPHVEPEDLEKFKDFRERMIKADNSLKAINEEGFNPLNATEQAEFIALGEKFKKPYPSLYREFEKVYARYLLQVRDPDPVASKLAHQLEYRKHALERHKEKHKAVRLERSHVLPHAKPKPRSGHAYPHPRPRPDRSA